VIRLFLVAAATYVTWRMIPRVVEENRSVALLPPPSPASPPNQRPIGVGLERAARNG
jgi:hypothetical protein